MQEIVPGIFLWSWFSERHGYDFNGYLVRDLAGNVCIDPVEMTEETLDQIVAAGVARIVLTNRNHTRASLKVHEATGAPVAMSASDAVDARAQGALIVEELRIGDRIGPLRVLDAHGKSPGEVALEWPERRILIVGDACVGKPPGGCALLPLAVIDDLSALQGSLRRIAAEVDFDTLLLCDGAPILKEARAALARLVATFP